jgi:hypothetical protein
MTPEFVEKNKRKIGLQNSVFDDMISKQLIWYGHRKPIAPNKCWSGCHQV